MHICQLDWIDLLFTPLYVHKVQPISGKLRSPHSHGKLRELVSLPPAEALNFLKRHTRLIVKRAIRNYKDFYLVYLIALL